MSTYTQDLHQIVLATKNRRPTLLADRMRDFLAYGHGTIKGLNCHLYRISCVDDHLHMLISLHPTVAPAMFVKKFKESTGKWIKGNRVFPGFDYWQKGYGGFTKSWEQKDVVIEYIKNQEEHHRVESFLDEFRRLVEEAGLKWIPEYLP